MATVATPYAVALKTPMGANLPARKSTASTNRSARPHNFLSSLGKPLSHQQSFAKVAASLHKGRRGGGSDFAQCNKGDEIFHIAAILNGLVLVGVAVGFVLLRIEAAVEESE